jgi:hypothetical protein
MQFELHLIQYDQAAAPFFILHNIGRQLVYKLKKQRPVKAIAIKD